MDMFLCTPVADPMYRHYGVLHGYPILLRYRISGLVHSCSPYEPHTVIVRFRAPMLFILPNIPLTAM